MKALLRWFGAILLIALALAAYPVWRIVAGLPFTIDQLADREMLRQALHDPELLSSIGLVDGTLLDFHSDRLTEIDVAARDAQQARVEAGVAMLRRFDRSRLSVRDQVTYDALESAFGPAAAYREFEWRSAAGLYPVNPMDGVQTQTPQFLASMHPVRTQRGARHFVARLGALGRKIDQAIAETKRQADAGVVPPLSILVSSQVQVRAFLDAPAADHALVAGFVGQLQTMADLSADDRRDLREQAIAQMQTSVYPAYRRLSAALSELQARYASPNPPPAGDGLWRLPGGDRYYRLELRQHTGSTVSPERLHEMGLQEVARIGQLMDTRLRELGLAQGSVGERVAALASQPSQRFANDDAARQAMLAEYRRILADIGERMPRWFERLPASPLEVRRTPQHAQAGAAAGHYHPPALDGSRPGVFFVNLRDPSEVPRFAMKTLAYHEGLPGHHFQIALAQSQGDLPLVRRLGHFTAYTEGWALYAETLAAEMGAYDGDPAGDLGRLRDEMWRAVRLVVDTGLHAQRWSRERAIGYMIEHTGVGQAEAAGEIERYMVMPGQACAYKVGQLSLLSLREKARKSLGPRFDIRRFHAVVLDQGAVPLASLEQLVDRWITEETKR